MSSKLVDYAQAVESVFHQSLPQDITISTHMGEFGEEEIRRFMVKTPAVVLAPLAVDKVTRAGGNALVSAHWAAFIMTRDKPELSRGFAALAITEAVLGFIPFTTFGCARAPEDVESANLYSGKVDRMGLTLWAVRWRSMIQLAAKDECSYASLDDFLRLNTTYNLDPVDDPADFDAEQMTELEGPEDE